jgi:hypothetical protein
LKHRDGNQLTILLTIVTILNSNCSNLKGLMGKLYFNLIENCLQGLFDVQRSMLGIRLFARAGFVQTLLTGIIFTLWISTATAVNSCSLKNDKITFTCNSQDSEQLQLNYLLAGKSYPALTIKPQLNNSPATVKYIISCDKVDENSRIIKLKSPNGQSGSVHFTFGTPNNCIKIAKCKNIKALNITFISKALLLPDEIGEHLVVYPNRIAPEGSLPLHGGKNKISCSKMTKLCKLEPNGSRPSKLKIPSDNYLVVNMLNSGNAILSCLWDSPQLKLTATQAVNGDSFIGLTIYPKPDTTIWFGINAAKNIWHKVKVNLTRSATAVQWIPPFKANWYAILKKGKSDFPVENLQCDAWIMADFDSSLCPKIRKNIGFTNDNGTAWTSGIGSFIYPFFQKKNMVYLLYPKYRHQRNSYARQFRPLIVPLQSNHSSSKQLNLPYDIREQLLDKKIIKTLQTVAAPKRRQPATCGTTARIEKIFYRETEKKNAQKIKERFRRMNIFVDYNRARIEEYLKWSRKIIQQLSSYQKQHPKSAATIKSLKAYLQTIQKRYNNSQAAIKTPKYCKNLTRQWIDLINAKLSAEVKEERSKKLGRQIRTIGGHQDELVGNMRDITKAFRLQVTSLLMQDNSGIATDFLQKLRHETARIMHFKYDMEGK